MYILLIVILAIGVFILIKLTNQKPKEKLRFLDLHEYTAKLFNDLAIDNIRNGNSEKVIYYFSKAIELNQEVFVYYLNRGNYYSKLELPTLAVIDWEAASKYGSVEAAKLLEKYTFDQLTKTDESSVFEKTLNDFGLRFIYHMTHKSNLQNILQNGLLSHNSAYSQNFTKTDISDIDVNSRRGKVHDFVPFYFNPKNPMLYKRKNIQNDIIILGIDRTILKSDFKFTDGNAASNSTKFYSEVIDLAKLNWSIINSEYWSGFIDGKRIRCSEILIPNEVKTGSIKKIFCHNSDTEKYVKSKLGCFEIEVAVNQDFYF